ncbi:MAG: hypothetical protein SGI77_10010 [Pirellulaceae bacterium]|nr:hypothetical protein [Pirellulaceae bacterium]
MNNAGWEIGIGLDKAFVAPNLLGKQAIAMVAEDLNSLSRAMMHGKNSSTNDESQETSKEPVLANYSALGIVAVTMSLIGVYRLRHSAPTRLWHVRSLSATFRSILAKNRNDAE